MDENNKKFNPEERLPEDMLIKNALYQLFHVGLLKFDDKFVSNFGHKCQYVIGFCYNSNFVLIFNTLILIRFIIKYQKITEYSFMVSTVCYDVRLITANQCRPKRRTNCSKAIETNENCFYSK